MKLLIAGSRHLKFDLTAMQNFIDNLVPEDIMIDEVVSGCAQGIDRSGINWAEFHNIPVKKFKPEWDKFGNAAGPIRNTNMAAYADALLLIWDGSSRGSADMKQKMQDLNKPIYEVVLNKASEPERSGAW